MYDLLRRILRQPSSGHHDAKRETLPELVMHRALNNDVALVFVHGFSGNVAATWENFTSLVLEDESLNAWDVISLGYPTSLSLDLPVWTADPDIEVCAKSLSTRFRYSPLHGYKAIAIVAHSMGGLIVQRALVDDVDLRRRTSHFAMFGTPSLGIQKAAFGARLKAQLKNMCLGSEFLNRLRRDWDAAFTHDLPFVFRTVAGNKDAFVPASSSLSPFPLSTQDVVPGDHLSIVRPSTIHSYSYQILRKLFFPGAQLRSSAEAAQLAVEHCDFQTAIAILMPHPDGLDDSAIVTLSLALESVGRTADALNVLDRWHRLHPECELDPRGTLAGRLKRRWLVERQASDYERALALYSEALEAAEAKGEHHQAYYNAVNVAYLLLEKSPLNVRTPDAALNMAARALQHALVCLPYYWAEATVGEAQLIMGNFDQACASYKEALLGAKNSRERDSMALQAISIASRNYTDLHNQTLRDIFRSAS